jgi:hypothetical protein
MSKTNSTPDLDDEQYMEQLHLMAQAISVLPGAKDGMRPVSTPAPIRTRWAEFLLTLGVRIHPEVATHELVATSPASGNHGPKLSMPRGSLNRDDLWKLLKEMAPETYDAIQRGELDRAALEHKLIGNAATANRLNDDAT